MTVDASVVVAQAVENAVMRSFQARPLPLRGITRAEAKRRVHICEQIWQVLRLEQHWSLQRVCDHLYRYLVAEIDGVQWEPGHRSVWAPDVSQKGQVT